MPSHPSPPTVPATSDPIEPSPQAWRRKWLIVLAFLVVWQLLWLALAYFASRGKEFGGDVGTYRTYINDPTVLLSERHKSAFGGGIAAPLLPLELAAWVSFFKLALPEFLALRLTMVVHVTIGMAIGLWFAFRDYGAPRGRSSWLIAILLATIPVGWVGGAIMTQDDSVSAAWAGIALWACVAAGPIAGTLATGAGMFFAKPFLAVTIGGIWIGYPKARRAVTVCGVSLGLLFLAFLWWRDGNFELLKQFIVRPFMGASPYGIWWMLFGEFSERPVRNLATFLTAASIAAFAAVAVRRRLSVWSAVVGLYCLFFTFFYGVMPEYEMWYLPFLLVVLWQCAQRGQWGTFACGWLHSFFGFGYKVAYGFNPRFANSGKPGIKTWYLEHIGWDVQGFQIALALATIACSAVMAVLLLARDPFEPVENQRVSERKAA